MATNDKGSMSVREAGRRGGAKGGRTVAEKYDRQHFSEIGQKGGQRVHDLIEKGKEREGQ